VIVTDDTEAGNAASMILSEFPWARWVEGPQRGPAANRNHGAGHARGEWLAFTDDDCLPSSGWIAAFAEIGSDSKTPLLEGKTKACGNRTRVDMECPVNLTGGYLWSCNFAIRRDLFESIGGFDECFPYPAMEDVDLRVRLRDQGIVAEFVPSAEVDHPWRPRKGKRHERQVAKSIAYFISKHPNEARSFTVAAQGIGLARYAVRQLPEKMRDAGARGLVRDVGITLYSFLHLAYKLHSTLKSD
jgi:GT2 family glycosyltransferase